MAAGRWHPVWGDRCQELVWIGIDMALGPDGWLEQLEDPLPPWVEGDEEEEWEEEEEEEVVEK